MNIPNDIIPASNEQQRAMRIALHKVEYILHTMQTHSTSSSMLSLYEAATDFQQIVDNICQENTKK